MNTKAIGFLVGILTGIVVFVLLMLVVNKNRSVKTEYDERQELLRGKGFKYGFFAGLIYVVVLMLLDMMEIAIPATQEVIYFSIIFVAATVMTSYCILTGAYFGINNDRKRFYILSIFVMVINLLTPIRFMIDGSFIQNGLLSTSCINLMCATLFFFISVECIIRNVIEKEAGEADEEP